MYMTSLERMWGYLHDDTACVSEYLFVTDPYVYTSNFIDLLARNPEVIPLLKERIAFESYSSGGYGLIMRGGYGRAEYRLIRMMKIKSFKGILERTFPELKESNEEPKLRLSTRFHSN